MTDRSEKIIETIKAVEIVDYEDAEGRPTNVGEVTAALIYNAVAAVEPEAEDYGWQVKPGDPEGTQPYRLWKDDTTGFTRILISSPQDTSNPVAIGTKDDMAGLIRRLQRAKRAIGTKS